MILELEQSTRQSAESGIEKFDSVTLQHRLSPPNAHLLRVLAVQIIARARAALREHLPERGRRSTAASAANTAATAAATVTASSSSATVTATAGAAAAAAASAAGAGAGTETASALPKVQPEALALEGHDLGLSHVEKAAHVGTQLKAAQPRRPSLQLVLERAHLSRRTREADQCQSAW